MKDFIKKNIANICSMLNAMCGLNVILFISFYNDHHAIKIACLFIVFGAFFDSIDGMLARSFNATSDLGKQLDSFADIVTFGIAPISIFIALHRFNDDFNLTAIQISIGVFYIMCAIYRLARFNLAPRSNSFEGLPTTASGLILSIYIMITIRMSYFTGLELHYTYLTDAIIITLALLMVSKIKVDKIGANNE